MSLTSVSCVEALIPGVMVVGGRTFGKLPGHQGD